MRWSATRSSSASTCEDSTTDMPSAAAAVTTVAMKSCRVTGSSIATGSSSTSSCGRRASATGQRELRPLATGQLPGLPVQRHAQLAQPGPRVALVEAAGQVAGQVQQVRGRHVLVQWRVLGDERDAIQRRRGSGRPAAEHGDAADGAARPTARFSRVVLPAPFGPTSAAT